MTFQSTPGTISWKIRFNSPPEKVFTAVASNEGRSAFWAESAVEKNGVITFRILNYAPYSGKIIFSQAAERFIVEYFGTVADFKLQDDGNGGTELTLRATEVADSIHNEMTAGWVSVLMAMKAYVDHGVDLRNHDKNRTWAAGYADN